MGGSAIDPTILTPLLIMAGAFTLLFFTLHLAAMRNEILRRRVRTHAADAGAEVCRGRRMNLGPHAAFIVVSLHASPLFVVVALIGWVMLDHASQRRMLRRSRGARD